MILISMHLKLVNRLILYRFGFLTSIGSCGGRPECEYGTGTTNELVSGVFWSENNLLLYIYILTTLNEVRTFVTVHFCNHWVTLTQFGRQIPTG